MNFLEKIISSLSGTMAQPQMYGWFHLMFLAITIVFTITMSLIFKNKSDKAVKIVVLSYAIVCLVLELYKQLLFSYTPSTDKWSYQWYAFPFQLCSTPMYVALVASLLKKGKVQDSLYAYLATFSLLAGLAVMIMPGDVFVSATGINIQTMVHHGGQVFIGIFLLVTKSVKLDFKTPLRALPAFITLVAIALTLNLTIVNFIGTHTFNMFFISPYFSSGLPVFSVIQPLISPALFILLYIVALTLGAYLITLLAMLSRLIVKSSKRLYYKMANKPG